MFRKRTEPNGQQSRRKRRSRKRKIWDTFVMLVGYAALGYLLCRGIILLLVGLNGVI